MILIDELVHLLWVQMPIWFNFVHISLICSCRKVSNPIFQKTILNRWEVLTDQRKPEVLGSWGIKYMSNVITLMFLTCLKQWLDPT